MAPHTVSYLTRPQRLPLVRRQRLLRTLDEASSGRSSLIRAPAGCGKSVLLEQWREELVHRGVKAHLLRCKEAHQDRSEFVRDLCEGLEEFGIEYSSASGGCIEELLETLTACERPLAVLLDDFDKAQSDGVNDLVTALAWRLPSHVSLALAGRTTLRLPIVQLAAAGLIVEIPPRELMFTRAETAELEASVERPENWANLIERCEGWPILTQLARHLLGSGLTGQDARNVLANPAGPVFRYIAEQIADRMEADQLCYLMELAVTGARSADAADAILGRADSRALLSTLADLGPLLEHRGSEELRMHGMLAAYLRDRLAREDKRSFTSIHLSAARWCGQQDEIFASLMHAQEAADPREAAIQAEGAGGIRLMYRMGMPAFRAIYSLLQPQTVSEFPRLTLGKVLVLLSEGSAREAFALFHEVERETAGFARDRPGGNPHQLRLDAQTVWCYATAITDVVCSNASLARLNELQQLTPQSDLCLRGFIHNLRSLCDQQRGDLLYAEVSAHEYARLHALASCEQAQFFAPIQVGLIEFARGNLSQALQAYQTAEQANREKFGSSPALGMMSSVLQAEVALERNDLVGSSQLIAQCSPLITGSEGWYETHVAAFHTAARIASHCSGWTDAVGILNRALIFFREREHRAIGRMLRLCKVETLLLGERLEEAEAEIELDRSDLEQISDASTIPWRERDARALAIASQYLKRGDFESALGRIMEAEADAARGARRGSLVRLNVLRTLIHLRADQTHHARSSFLAALRLAAPQNLQRPFTEHASALRSLIADAAGAAHDPTLSSFAQELLQHIPSGSDSRDALVAFTERERDVLEHLITRESDKEIARSLSLSVHTVKHHLKNISLKLGVSGRKNVVAAAGRHGLLAGRDAGTTEATARVCINPATLIQLVFAAPRSSVERPWATGAHTGGW